jgi:hypothetical protein
VKKRGRRPYLKGRLVCVDQGRVGGRREGDKVRVKESVAGCSTKGRCVWVKERWVMCI